MHTNYNKALLALFIIASILLSNDSVLLADDVFRVGIFPRRSVALTEKMFTPLSNYLELQLDQKVVLDVAPDMPAFWSRLEDGKYDMVHLNQYHYVRAHAKLGWQAILRNEEFGEDTIAAGIWVLKDSDINNLHDLRGKLVVFGGGDHAMVASIMPRDILMKAGITNDTYIGMSTLHPVKSIVSVYFNQADAAGVGTTILKHPAIKKKIDVGKLKLLAKSNPLAHLPWAVRADLDTNKKNKIIQSMQLLNETLAGKKVLMSAGLTGIHPATDADYDEHRAIVKRVLGEEY